MTWSLNPNGEAHGSREPPKAGCGKDCRQGGVSRDEVATVGTVASHSAHQTLVIGTIGSTSVALVRRNGTRPIGHECPGQALTKCLLTGGGGWGWQLSPSGRLMAGLEAWG